MYMKKTWGCVVVIWALTVSAMGADAPIVFRSMFSIGETPVFSVSTPDGTNAAWVGLGDRYAGCQISGFSKEEKVLVVQKDGREWRIPLAHAAPIAAPQTIVAGTTKEELLQAVEGLPLQAQVLGIMTFQLAGMADLTEAIKASRSPEEMAVVLRNHRALIELWETTSHHIADSVPPEEFEIAMRGVWPRMVEDRARFDGYLATLQDLKFSPRHAQNPDIRAAIAELEKVGPGIPEPEYNRRD
jgi:hypothetical protein